MVFDKVRDMIAEQLQVDAAAITAQSRLVEDLKADSANVIGDDPRTRERIWHRGGGRGDPEFEDGWGCRRLYRKQPITSRLKRRTLLCQLRMARISLTNE